MMRLFWHPESEAYFLEQPGDWQNTADGGLCEDVSEIEHHRRLAVLDDIDLSEITAPQEPEKVKAVGMSGAIAEAMRKWARKPADLYPTPVDCTYSLIPHIAHLLPPDASIWEPACADGQMVDPLRQYGYRVMATDLRPDIKGGQGGVDFLVPGSLYHSQQYDAIMTNPPFSVADQFIRRALEHAPVVVMLLKAQYWNTKNRKALFRETKPYMELNLTWRPAFLAKERGNSPLMDCMWVVWVRGNNDLPRMDMIDRLDECPFNYAAMETNGL